VDRTAAKRKFAAPVTAVGWYSVKQRRCFYHTAPLPQLKSQNFTASAKAAARSDPNSRQGRGPGFLRVGETRGCYSTRRSRGGGSPLTKWNGGVHFPLWNVMVPVYEKGTAAAMVWLIYQKYDGFKLN